MKLLGSKDSFMGFRGSEQAESGNTVQLLYLHHLSIEWLAQTRLPPAPLLLNLQDLYLHDTTQ